MNQAELEPENLGSRYSLANSPPVIVPDFIM